MQQYLRWQIQSFILNNLRPTNNQVNITLFCFESLIKQAANAENIQLQTCTSIWFYKESIQIIKSNDLILSRKRLAVAVLIVPRVMIIENAYLVVSYPRTFKSSELISYCWKRFNKCTAFIHHISMK